MLTRILTSLLILICFTSGYARAEEAPLLQADTYEVLSKAQKDMEKFDYQSAKEKLLALLQKESLKDYDLAVSYQTLGYVDNGLGDFDAAANAFVKALQLDALPKKVTHELLFSAAQLLIHLEKPEQGLQYLSKWFADEPSPGADAHIVAASAYYQLENYEQLIFHVEKALALKDSPPLNWYELLLAACFETKKYSKAAEVLENIIARFPDKKDYWLQLAGIYQELKKERRALAVYELAYNKELLKSDDILQLVRMYLYLEMPYKAANVLEKELAIGGVDENRENLTLLGDSWLLARENDKAESIFAEVINRYKDNEIRLRLGQLLVETEQWQKAVELLDKRIDTNDNKLVSNINLLLGIAQYNLDKTDQAFRAFNRALTDKSTKDQARWWIDYLQKQIDKNQAG